MMTLNYNWKQAWNYPPLRVRIITGSILIFGILSMLPSFFNMVEKRMGPTLNDRVLAVIPAHNVSGIIFSIIWGMGILILVRAINRPSIYINYVWSLIFILIIRAITITLFPLNPPNGILILSDPLTNLFYGERVITKDLFFSGHTAILVLTTLCLENKKDKIIGVIAATIVGFLLLVQHVHYTLDVVAAPLIVYPLYRLAKFLLAVK
jgi:hypothetical protein